MQFFWQYTYYTLSIMLRTAYTHFVSLQNITQNINCLLLQSIPVLQ